MSWSISMPKLKQLITYLEGKKTYLLFDIAALAYIAGYFGVITPDAAKQIEAACGITSIASLRAAIAKTGTPPQPPPPAPPAGGA